MSALQWIAVLRLCVELTGTYNIEDARSGYVSIGIDCFLLYVKFEDGSCISVLRNRAARYETVNWKSTKDRLQKRNGFKRRPLASS